ncbi:MAG: response regulator [Pseudomonadota bacterium]
MRNTGRLRILVVDDNAHARAILSQIFSAADIDVTPAASGPEALTILKTLRVDAVFVDMVMQPMDGIALTRAIRKLGNLEVARLPVIMASAHTSREVVKGGLEAGVTGFVAKPFVPVAVLKRLRSALNPPARPDANSTFL